MFSETLFNFMFTETRLEFMFSETLFNFMFTGLMSFGNPPLYPLSKIPSMCLSSLTLTIWFPLRKWKWQTVEDRQRVKWNDVSSKIQQFSTNGWMLFYMQRRNSKVTRAMGAVRLAERSINRLRYWRNLHCAYLNSKLEIIT